MMYEYVEYTNNCFRLAIAQLHHENYYIQFHIYQQNIILLAQCLLVKAHLPVGMDVQPATQLQVLMDANFSTKLVVGAPPPVSLKKTSTHMKIYVCICLGDHIII
jgi:hypothetical protein